MTKFYGKETGLKSKYIAGFGKKYIIYSDGRVYNTLSHKYIKQSMNHGFLQVRLCYREKCCRKYVDRLVAESFLYYKNLPSYFIVHHVDSNKLNNSLNNLCLDDTMAEMLLHEIIKQIKGFDHYYISNMGRVFFIDDQDDVNLNKHRLVPQSNKGAGYLKVGMKNNKGKWMVPSVHRLVAQAFIPNPDNKSTVNHKNEIKTDNRVDNLEWFTMKEQLNYGKFSIREKRVRLCRTNHEVMGYSEKYHRAFYSIGQASRVTGISKSNISRCVRGKQAYAGTINGEKIKWKKRDE